METQQVDNSLMVRFLYLPTFCIDRMQKILSDECVNEIREDLIRNNEENLSNKCQLSCTEKGITNRDLQTLLVYSTLKGRGIHVECLLGRHLALKFPHGS